MADGDVRAPHTRRAVSLSDRAELEDKHLRLMEENLLLKKHARSQEEKMKKMATKLLRLAEDDRKEARRDGHILAGGHHYDPDVVVVMDELRSRVRELEKRNDSLKSKVLVLRQQIDSRGKRHTPYQHVESKIRSGLSKRSVKSLSTEDVSLRRPTSRNVGTQSVSSLPRYGHSLLEQAREDNQELEELVLKLKEEIALCSAEAERSTEQLRLQAACHEEAMLKLQGEHQARLNGIQRLRCENEREAWYKALPADYNGNRETAGSNIQEDVELIKLQRELKEKGVRLQTLQSQYTSIERSLEVMRASHSKLLQEMETLNAQLNEERRLSSSLQAELRGSAVSQRALGELQEMVSDLREEKEQLKRSNDALRKSVQESDEGGSSRLRSVLERAAQLEAAVKQELAEKTRAIDRLSRERELSGQLDAELREAQQTYLTLKEDHQRLKQRLAFFEKESSVDWGEVEEALVLVREGRVRGEGRRVEPLSFLEKVDGQECKESQRELLALQSAHADTIAELEKTRKLLALQRTINNDYSKEAVCLHRQLSESREEQLAEQAESARLLDIKAARIQKLEKQLRDIAYGTRHYKIDTGTFEYDDVDSPDTIELQRGQNLMQVHMGQVLLSSEALSHLHTPTPSLFLAVSFYHFEAQVSQVVQGPRPLVNFTSNFAVAVDDSFLTFLQKGSVGVELHQSFGTKHRLLATGSVHCRELLHGRGDKLHGKVVLTGVESLQQCVSVGSVDHWLRLKLPMTQALRLFQERSKALSLVDKSSSVACAPTVKPATTAETTRTTLPSLADSASGHHQQPGADFNELSITVVGCAGLEATKGIHPPSPYVMYKLYTFPDHDTVTAEPSFDPVFADVVQFPVAMDAHLEEYLERESLEVYVFDDLDPVETNFLGVARVPLQPLTSGPAPSGSALSGSFPLLKHSGTAAGSVEVSMKWSLPYTPPHSPPTPPPQPSPVLQARTQLAPSSKAGDSRHREPTVKQELSTRSKSGHKANARLKSHKHRMGKRTQDLCTDSEVSLPETESSDSIDVFTLGTHDKQSSTLRAPLRRKPPPSTTPQSKSADKDSTKKKTTSTVTRPETRAPSNTATVADIRSVTVPRTGIISQEVLPEAGVRERALPSAASVEASQTLHKSVRVKPLQVLPPVGIKSNGESVALSQTTDIFPVHQDGIVEEGMDPLSGNSSVSDLEDPPGGQKFLTPSGGSNKLGVGQFSFDEDSDMGSITQTELSEQSGDEGGRREGERREGGRREGERREGERREEERREGTSEEEVEEDLEESLTEEEEDTMFEETLPHMAAPSDDDHLSDLSPHSSDLADPHPPPLTPTPGHQSVILVEGGAGDTPDLSPSDSEAGDTITFPLFQRQHRSPADPLPAEAAHMSITVESFAMERDSPLLHNSAISQLFVEYQFLDFDSSELETPSFAKPSSGEVVSFAFTKELVLSVEQRALLSPMLQPAGDPPLLTFTLVSDPEDQMSDCVEVGTAEINLCTILQRREDLVDECIDVFSVDEEMHTLGYLTISVTALELLRRLV